jgi:hypothetical protein
VIHGAPGPGSFLPRAGRRRRRAQQYWAAATFRARNEAAWRMRPGDLRGMSDSSLGGRWRGWRHLRQGQPVAALRLSRQRARARDTGPHAELRTHRPKSQLGAGPRKTWESRVRGSFTRP